jgi:hypothetical protein
MAITPSPFCHLQVEELAGVKNHHLFSGQKRKIHHWGLVPVLIQDGVLYDLETGPVAGVLD